MSRMRNLAGGCADAAVALCAAWELVYPQGCAGCGYPGVGWCAGCRTDVAARTAVRAVWPQPVPVDFPPTWVALSYDGAVRHALATYKDDDRRDLASELAPLLALSLRVALADGVPSDAVRRRGQRPTPALIVPVPSSRQARRRRGDAPLLALARGACAAVGDPRAWVLRPDALMPTRRVADQAGLDQAARAGNLAGAFVAVRSLEGADVVVVDDVVTTGATLAEAARALQAAGAGEVRAACIAATVRRRRVGPAHADVTRTALVKCQRVN